MCLFTNSSEVKIAKKPKRYIKAVGTTIDKTTWAPLYQPTCRTNNGEIIIREYPFNKILDAEDDNSNKIVHLTIAKLQIGYNTVYEGFHAYVNVMPPDYDLFEKIYKIVVIPKGAEYVISSNGYEIVTNKIIVFSNRFRYILYRLFGELTLCA